MAKQEIVVTDYRKRINQAAKFMQDNAFRQLSINEIAATANFSPFHFHRIFSAFTGETIFEYLTTVRMNKAVEMLIAGSRISHIAINSGYQTTAAFNKVFKKTFGCSTTVYRQKTPGGKMPFMPAITDVIKSDFQPVITILPDMNLLYVRRKGRNYGQRTKAADDAFYYLYNWLIKYFENPRFLKRIGIIQDVDEVNGDECRFDGCVEIDDFSKYPLTGDVKSTIISKGKWAIFLHKGPYNTLWQTWNRIYRYWLPIAGLELRDVSPFEIYHNSPLYTRPAELLTDIHIPIL